MPPVTSPGERGLLRKEPRATRIVCRTDVVACRIVAQTYVECARISEAKENLLRAVMYLARVAKAATAPAATAPPATAPPATAPPAIAPPATAMPTRAAAHGARFARIASRLH